MRFRATVAAVTGALALSALAVPAAHAADGPRAGTVAKTWGPVPGTSKFAASAAAAAPDLDMTFSTMKVNGGKPIVVGASGKASVPVTYTINHAASLDINSENFANGPFLYLGTSADPYAVDTLWGDREADCTATSTTTANCKAFIDIRPSEGALVNSDARTWKVAGLGLLTGGSGEVGQKVQGDRGTTKLQKYSKLTVNAAPEPVKKGKTITVTGNLTRANWETNKYAGYTAQNVILQFQKKGTTAYKNVKTVKSGSGGALKTTVKASVDGTFRYVFAGTSTTAAAKSAGDFVDVR